VIHYATAAAAADDDDDDGDDDDDDDVYNISRPLTSNSSVMDRRRPIVHI